MLLRMRCFVHFRSGRILFSLVVQRLLSRSANFDSRKHINNSTQEGFVNLRLKYERRGRNELNLVCSAAKQKHFVNNL